MYNIMYTGDIEEASQQLNVDFYPQSTAQQHQQQQQQHQHHHHHQHKQQQNIPESHSAAGNGRHVASAGISQSAKAFFSQLDWQQPGDLGYTAFAGESDSDSDSSSSEEEDEEMFNHNGGADFRQARLNHNHTVHVRTLLIHFCTHLK